MKITIWSDFVCPFCIIGENHLNKALKTFEHIDDVDIEYKSFLLMPDAKHVPGKSYAETFADLKGMPVEQAQAMLKQVTETAEHSGVNINYDIAKISSTADAQRVFQYAKEQGKGNEFFSRLYEAHFSQGEVLSDTDTIVKLAKELNLDGEKVQKIMESEEYEEKVELDVTEAQAVGVQGVPFFVFNNKYAVSGAQPVETFSQVLEQVWEEEQEN